MTSREFENVDEVFPERTPRLIKKVRSREVVTEAMP